MHTGTWPTSYVQVLGCGSGGELGARAPAVEPHVAGDPLALAWDNPWHAPGVGLNAADEREL